MQSSNVCHFAQWRGETLAAAAAAPTIVALACREAAGSGVHALCKKGVCILGTKPAVPIRWRFVASLGPRANLAALLYRPVGENKRKQATCRPGIPC